MCIKEQSSLEDRKERGKAKDIKYRKMVKELSYKNEGELFLKSLTNACISKLVKEDNYQVN